MNSNSKGPINIALYGMDERTRKVMSMFFHGPCNGVANVVSEYDADIDIVDVDFINAKEVLGERRLKTPKRPVIILSSERQSIEGTIFIKKPVQTAELLSVLSQMGAVLKSKQYKKSGAVASTVFESKIEQQDQVDSGIRLKKALKKQEEKNIDNNESKKISKHQVAKELVEGSYFSYISHIDNIDFSDQYEILRASFNPKSFFLGYVQSAYNVAKAKKNAVQLDSGWRPLVILPKSHEVWLGADDKQLKAFAGIARKNNPGKKMLLVPFDQEVSLLAEKMDGFYDMDVFIWKLAVWTSKGRYPDSIDINKPVYLRQWPNFARVLVTPHAIRIAALLIDGPRKAMNIVDLLKIKPQHVFIFISAAHAVGILGQAQRQMDEIFSPPDIKASKDNSLLSNILARLRD